MKQATELMHGARKPVGQNPGWSASSRSVIASHILHEK